MIFLSEITLKNYISLKKLDQYHLMETKKNCVIDFLIWLNYLMN